jgi:hypothetical protein
MPKRMTEIEKLEKACESRLDKLFDKILKPERDILDDNIKEYLVFYDKDGIMPGGLWILFQKRSNTVLKVLHDRTFGDILLAIDITNRNIVTYEQMETMQPDPKHITGIAIPVSEEPKDYGKCITRYIRHLKKAMKLDIDLYNKEVYKYLIKKISKCNLRVVKGLTMQDSGPKKINKD